MMERCNALSEDKELRFFKVIGCFAIVEQNHVAVFNPEPTVPVPERCRKLAKKKTYLSDTDNALSEDSSLSDSEVESWLSRRVLRHQRHLSTNLGWKKDHSYPGIKKLCLTNPLYVGVGSFCRYSLEDVSHYRSLHGTRKVWNNIKRMALKRSGNHYSGEKPIMIFNFLAKFVREANIQGLLEPQSLIALP